MRFPRSAWHRELLELVGPLPTYISRGLWLETQLQCHRLRRSEAWLAASNATVVFEVEIEGRGVWCAARGGGWDGEVSGKRLYVVVANGRRVWRYSNGSTLSKANACETQKREGSGSTQR
jgi:hypothetical protein